MADKLGKFDKTGKWVPADLNTIDLRLIAVIFRPARGATGGQNVVTVLNKGKREYYQLAPDLYRAMHTLDTESTIWLVRALAVPARLLRATATSFSLDFTSRNAFRDAGEAMVQAQDGFIPGWDSAKGLFHVLKRDDLYWEWKRAGGEHAAMVSMDRANISGSWKR